MTIDEVNAQFDALQAAFNKAATDAGKYITDLKAQVAAGTPVTQAQLDALGGNLTALNTAVQQFDINNTEPPVIVPPPPPPPPPGPRKG
jgi:hypothetical protein